MSKQYTTTALSSAISLALKTWKTIDKKTASSKACTPAKVATKEATKETSKETKLDPAPVKVSPLIKLARWCFLIAGIFYGFSKNQFLAIREVDIRAQEEKERKIREAHQRAEREKQSQQDIQMLTEIFLGPQE